MTKTYDSTNISSLGFPENVRRKPGMYMGEMGSPAMWQIVREVADNCIDECLAGHASTVDLVIDGDTFSVVDNGRGIPSGFTTVTNVGDNKKVKVPTLRAVFGVMHTSGKFNDQAYKVSRGSHGCGAKGSNALSSTFVASTYADGKWNSVEFAEGKVVNDVHPSSAPKHPALGTSLKGGTLVSLSPDYKVVGKGSRLSMADLTSWCQISAYFTPGLTINAYLRKGNKFVSRVFHAPDGAVDYIKDRVQVLLKGGEFSDVVDQTFTSTSYLHDCVLRFTTYDGSDARSFTNGLLNSDGGTHQASVFAALKDSLTPYLQKKQAFTVNELKDGLVGLVNIKLSEPKFASQTKEKLVDERGGAPLKELLQADLDAWFKKNRKIALALVDRASRLKDMKSKFVASKQMLSALRKISAKGLPAVAATAPKCRPEERECYLLEGASASGGMRFARDEHFQEFLPLKGKPKNVTVAPTGRKAKQSETSVEILNIFAMLGFDPKLEDPMSKLRIGKLIVMADADSDGSHIQTLIFGVLFRYLPSLFEKGMVYVTRVPEYYSVVGKDVFSGDSLEEVQNLLVEHKAKGVVSHVKGYGEISSDLLRVFACDPATRSLYRVKPVGMDRFELLMGNDSGPRKQLLGL